MCTQLGNMTRQHFRLAYWAAMLILYCDTACVGLLNGGCWKSLTEPSWQRLVWAVEQLERGVVSTLSGDANTNPSLWIHPRWCTILDVSVDDWVNFVQFLLVEEKVSALQNTKFFTFQSSHCSQSKRIRDQTKCPQYPRQGVCNILDRVSAIS